MSKSLKEWLKEIEPLKKMSKEDPETFYGEKFFRDPLHPEFTDCDFFFSPADGIIIDQKECDADEDIVDIKGIEYTPQKLIEDEDFKERSLVISIFMSQYHVHVNRIPTDGIIYWKMIEPLQTLNRPMIFEERDILEGHVDHEHEDYPVNNGRCVNTIFNGRYRYFLVQIADSDVKVIAPFSRDQGEHYTQNERFGIVRYGSQVTLILPLTESFNLKPLEKVERVVEAGLDKLVYIESKEGYSIAR